MRCVRFRTNRIKIRRKQRFKKYTESERNVNLVWLSRAKTVIYHVHEGPLHHTIPIALRNFKLTTQLNALIVSAGARSIRSYSLCKRLHNRKAWLFAKSVDGANASANLYSLVETAKANGHEPHSYIQHVLTQLPAATSLEGIEALLPFNLQPDECHVA